MMTTPFIHPEFDPIALSIGPLSIRWYGLMYLIGFVLFIVLGRIRLKKQSVLELVDLDNLLTFGVLGVVLGGRLGYVLFYKPAYYLQHPLEVFSIWQGGMSFHGGFIGVMVAVYIYAKRKGWSFWTAIDFVAPLVPPGLAAGRIGNFINGELWGRPTDGPWAVVFPQAGDMLPRHPSQLYQMALEGFTLFALLWWYSSKPRPKAAVSAVFLLGYGAARFIVEFGREPDRFLGTLALGLSMGQWLCVPMLIAGVVLHRWAYAQKNTRQ